MEIRVRATTENGSGNGPTSVIRGVALLVITVFLSACATAKMRHCDNVMYSSGYATARGKAIVAMLPKRDFDDTRTRINGGCLNATGHLDDDYALYTAVANCEEFRLTQDDPEKFYCMPYAVGGNKTELQSERERAWQAHGQDRQDWIDAFLAISSGITAGLGGTPIAPQYRHLVAARATGSEAHSEPAAVTQSNSCDGYQLQTTGDGPVGTVCRCSYGPGGQIGWWAVTPGQAGATRCGAPGTSSYSQTQTVPAYQQSAPMTAPTPSPQHPHTQPPVAVSSPSPSPSPLPSPSPRPQPQPQPPQYRPAWTHRGDIERRWQDSRQVSSFAVKVTNTGDVRLFCRATATARVAFTDGGSCVGVSALNCSNGRSRSETRTAAVYPGSTVVVVTLGDFLSDGRYDVNCGVDPS